MLYSTRRRHGLTMAEVLIALFTTALGLMAILTLFPLGAAQMAQAIKDDRCAHAAHLATVEARILWRELWEKGTAMSEPFVKAMDDPDDSSPFKRGYPNRAGNPGRSYPVIVDPLGYKNLLNVGATENPYWAGGYWPTVQGPPLFWLPRRSLKVIEDTSGLTKEKYILRYSTMLDDLEFNRDGKPVTPLTYQGKYTWMYMFQRHNNTLTREVNLTVLVMSTRPSDIPSYEAWYSTVFAVGANYNRVQLTCSKTDRPQIKKGGWIMDPGSAEAPGGYFYRVVAVNEDPEEPSNQTIKMTLDVEPAITGRNSNEVGIVFVWPQLTEVFDRGRLTDLSLPTP